MPSAVWPLPRHCARDSRPCRHQRASSDVDLGVSDQVGVGVNHSLYSVGPGERLGTDTVTGRQRDDPVTECRGGER